MLLFAFALVLFAFANVGFTLKGAKTAGIAEYMAGYVIITLIAHLAMRRFAPWADPLLLPLAALLNGLGIVMTERLLLQNKLLLTPMNSSAAIIQVVYSAIGVGCFVAVLALIREPRVLQRYTYTLGAAGLLLVALPALLPASISEVQGAKIQIKLGSFTIQPEEFAKLALAAAFAGFLVAKRDVLALAGRRVLGIDLPRARSWSCGRRACYCWYSRATSAPARCSWGCSWPCCTSRPPGLPGCCSASSCSWPALSWRASCSGMSTSGSAYGCTRSRGRTRSATLSSWSRECTGWLAAACSARASAPASPT
jgi:hypothetical protein